MGRAEANPRPVSKLQQVLSSSGEQKWSGCGHIQGETQANNRLGECE